MALGLHGGGSVGIAFETTYGTYVAPSIFFPIRSESLKYVQDTQYRRVIRGLVDVIDPPLAGNSHVEGQIEMELIENVLPYFLYVSRNTIVKSGTGPNWVYTTTPANLADSTGLPKLALSITVVRAGQVFGYVGCVVGSIEIAVDNGIPIVRFNIIGSDEASQSAPTVAFTTTVGDLPFGAGTWSIQVPTATQVFDVENVTFTANDNAEVQFRLDNSTKGNFVKYGTREVSMEMTRDFISRAEYDLFKSLTTQTVTLALSKGTNNSVTVKQANSYRDGYDIDGLSDQGNLHMATVKYLGVYDAATSKSYEMIVKCQTSII